MWDNERWPNFSPDEFACKGDGTLSVNPVFMDRLQTLRTFYAKPMIISSGYRSPEYNASVSSTGLTGPHTTARAADIAVRGADALHLITLALEVGFIGIGVNQRGNSRFIHLDDLPDAPGQPRPWIWSY